MTKNEKEILRMKIEVLRSRLKQAINRNNNEDIDKIRQDIANTEYLLKTGKEYDEDK